MIFDPTGSLIAHPDFAQFVTSAMTHPAQPQLPNIEDIKSGLVAAVLQEWQGQDQYDGTSVMTRGGTTCSGLRIRFERQYSVSILLLAAQDDFVQNVRKRQVTGLVLAIVASAAFVPAVWIFGSRMSRSLRP